MDREKVIGHLLIIRTWNEVGKAYAHDEMDKREKAKTVEWIDETLEMLKEQDAVKPRVSTVEQRCGNCNKVIEMDGWKTCPWCGKPILWEAVGKTVKRK